MNAKKDVLQIQMLPGYSASHGPYGLNSDKPVHVFSTTQFGQAINLKPMMTKGRDMYFSPERVFEKDLKSFRCL